MGWIAGLLASVVEKLLILLGQDLIKWLSVLWSKIVRSNKEDAAIKKEEVNDGKPRDEQTKKEERDEINS